jgi:hypothetical protein
MWREELPTRSHVAFCHMLQPCACSVTSCTIAPCTLEQLITHRHPDSRLFLKHIRAFNANLAFTSTGVCEEDVTFSPGAPCYVISGEMHHLMGSLLPRDTEQGLFAQLYVYDAQEAYVTRAAQLMRVVRDRGLGLPRLLDDLAAALQDCTGYARVLRSVAARQSEWMRCL